MENAIRLEFIVHGDEAGSPQGVFTPTDMEKWNAIEARFEELIEDFEEERLSDKRILVACKAILKKEPDFLDAYAFLGQMHAEKPATALSWYKKGLAVALALLPEQYAGRIEWGFLENRPFLRCHHEYILTLIRAGKYDAAGTEIERHLQWNPNDNIGVRYLQGDVCLAAGDIDKASEALQRCAGEYPPCFYSLGLLEFRNGRHAQAATALRKGFLANPYIGEALNGRAALLPHAYWHASSHNAPGTAIEYLTLLGMDLWSADDEPMLFLGWLFNCSDCLRERADAVAIAERLLSEETVGRRTELLRQAEALLDAITDEQSARLVKKRPDRDGELLHPWELEGWSEAPF